MKARIFLALALAAAVGWMAGASGLAGEKKEDPFAKLPKPGPEHKVLAKLAGTWHAEVKSWFGPGEPKESKGTMVRKMIMDGRYLQEYFQGDFLGKKFQGLGISGYDVAKKKYVMAWIDNFGTGIQTNYGTYDGEAKTFTFLGEEDSPDFGGKMKIRDVLHLISADEQRFEMFRTPLKKDKEFKVMEIKYTRK
jgi:hypothetical protein